MEAGAPRRAIREAKGTPLFINNMTPTPLPPELRKFVTTNGLLEGALHKFVTTRGLGEGVS